MKATLPLLLLAGLLCTGSSLIAAPPPKETALFSTRANFESLDDRIFALGWSDKGKFAWLTLHLEEAGEEVNYSVSVVDATVGKTVETVPFTGKDRNAANFWKANEAAVLAILKKHSIKAGESVMDHFPLCTGEKRERAIAPILKLIEGEVLYGDGVLGYKLSLDVGEGLQPIILEEKVAPEQNMFAAAVAGAFTSPNGKFCAVVVTGLYRGYEAAPHIRKVAAVAGCPLEDTP